ncbi:YueI family protein [Agrilactobacillus fermenti]|uniref:YueI family protein n=1 Tax=Agrilactobacillus fermenti TaxID=2586909 RepID=UPI001E34052C|nr:YueI family protein [Agrilactobacillus fermenti]MCD2256156.1 YueI family protein [Agrilactobacillus fermenti]
MSDVEDYIKSHMYGTPQVKPDEKREFLGNFRERVALALTVAQLRNPKTEALVSDVMQRYPQYHLYLNAKLSQSFITTYMALAVKMNYEFTIITQEGVRVKTEGLAEEDMGLTIADPKKKIDRPIIL